MKTPAVHDADIPTRDVRVRASLPTRADRSTGSLVMSVLLHGAVILLVVYATAGVVEPPRGGAIMDAIAFASGGGGGGGAGRGTFIAVAPPRTAPPPAEPIPTPVVVPPTTTPVVAPTSTPTPTPAPVRDTVSAGTAAGGAGSGGGTGGGQGTGTGTGSGSGSGAGSGGGTGGGVAIGDRGTDPVPRQLMVPPLDFPKALRGQTVAVTFVVAADGRVVDIDVVPPIADRGYSRKFDEVMRSYRFRPARDPAGVAVAGTKTVEVTF